MPTGNFPLGNKNFFTCNIQLNGYLITKFQKYILLTLKMQNKKKYFRVGVKILTFHQATHHKQYSIYAKHSVFFNFFHFYYFFFARLARACRHIGGLLFALNGKHCIQCARNNTEDIMHLNSASGLFPEITSRLQNQSKRFCLSDQI